MEDKILSEVNKNLEGILAGQALAAESEKKAAERLKAIEESGKKQAEAIAAHDGRLKSQEDHLVKVEQALNTKRLNTGGGPTTEPDALRNALPDDLKAWLPRVAGLQSAGALHGADGTIVSPGRSAGFARMAQSDPVRYVAVGGWFQARIKATIFAQRGMGAKAEAWNKRAEDLAEAMGGFDVQAKAALQEDTNSEGGYLVPTVTEAMIGWLMKEASVVRQAGATVMTMTTKTHQLPTLANDFTVTWEAEEATVDDSGPAAPFGQGNLTAKKMSGLVTVSLELVQDNIIGLMDFVMTHLLMIMGREEDAQALEGDGTVFSGLFSVSGTNSVAGGSNALSEDELRKLIYGGTHATTLERGKIFAHPWIMRDAIGLAISSGSPWFATVFGQDQQGNARPRNIWGVPAYLTSVISKVRTANDTTAYHGDPSYIVIGDRMGTQFDVDPYGLFTTAQIRLRILRRTGILIWVPAYFTKLTAVTVT